MDTSDSEHQPSKDSSVREVFLRALEKPSAQSRGDFLDGACGTKHALRAKVEALLEKHRDDGFLEEPAIKFERDDDAGSSEQVDTMINRYKLLEKLGEGGFGSVWAAEQQEPVKRRVALKVIKLGMDTKQIVARFEAERQALALMDHPNIAKVFDAGATNTGRPYFVMELVRGIPITRYSDEEKLSTEDRLDLFIKVCHAVQHAHQKGIIHRDLKPSNILVESHDGMPVPKVIDFGIAKATQEELTDKTVYTKFQEFIGTPAYMSPEQAKLSGLDIDTRSDVYSLGVLLYELLTGTTPFDSKTLLAAGLDEMRRIIREQEPQRPSTKVAGLTEHDKATAAQHHSVDALQLVSLLRDDLDWIVMKCLEKERTRRYDTANGLAMDLVRHLKHEPIVARPPSKSYRLQKSWQRNKRIFTAGAAVALALLAGIAASTWQASVAIGAREVADEQRMKAKENEILADTARIKAEKALQLADEEAYAAHMLSAQTAWDNHDVAHLRRILAETADYSQRGFEWYYWQRLAHRESKTLRGHPQYVSAVDFSPDGRRFVTAGTNTAIVWDAATTEEEARFKIHDHVIWSAVFSPDSRLIATGSGDQTAKVWEAASGTVIHSFKEYDGGVRSAFSRDGTWIVTGSSENNTTEIWDVRTGELLSSLQGEPVEALAISPDGERTVTGNKASSTAKVWDVRSGVLVTTLAGDGGISSIAFSPDGERIATADWAGTAKVWNTEGDEEPRTFKGHSERIWCLAISPDSRWMVTGSQDSTAKVWNLATGKELFSLKGHGEGVASVAISPDGKRIITGARDQTAKLWDVDSDTILRTHDGGLTLIGHAERLWDAAISPDHRWMVTGSMDHTAKVWDAATGKVLRTLEGHNAGVTSVAISPDSQWIVTVSRDASAKVWDARKVAAPITLLGHATHIWSVAFSPDSRLIVTGSRDGIFKGWRVDTGDELFSVQGHNAAITSVTFSPDGRWIASASHDHTVKIWDTDSRMEKRVLKGHQDLVWSVAFSPDSRRIVTASEDTTAKVWDVESGEERLTLTGHRVPIQSAVFSPDGQRIATGSNDGTARLWEASNARALLVLKGHPWARIRSVAFSADGQRMVTASTDKTAKIWEVATEQQATDWLETNTSGEARENVSQYTGSFQRRAEGEIAKPDRKERAFNPGAIHRWLILAPVPVGDAYGSLNHKEAAEVLDTEQIPQEAQLSPRKGDKITVSNEVLAWIDVPLEDHLIDFNQVLGETTNDRVAYAVCYLHSETDQDGLIMTVHTEDYGKVYLNGREIHKNTAPRNYLSDPIRVPSVNLQAGRNVIVFKVVNRYHIWEGSIRLTTADGSPIEGIRLTLDPD